MTVLPVFLSGDRLPGLMTILEDRTQDPKAYAALLLHKDAVLEDPEEEGVDPLTVDGIDQGKDAEEEGGGAAKLVEFGGDLCGVFPSIEDVDASLRWGFDCGVIEDDRPDAAAADGGGGGGGGPEEVKGTTGSGEGGEGFKDEDKVGDETGRLGESGSAQEETACGSAGGGGDEEGGGAPLKA